MARKMLINLATGLEDPERVTVAFLSAPPLSLEAKQSRVAEQEPVTNCSPANHHPGQTASRDLL
jgi:hypothetical protein